MQVCESSPALRGSGGGKGASLPFVRLCLPASSVVVVLAEAATNLDSARFPIGSLELIQLLQCVQGGNRARPSANCTVKVIQQWSLTAVRVASQSTIKQSRYSVTSGDCEFSRPRCIVWRHGGSWRYEGSCQSTGGGRHRQRFGGHVQPKTRCESLRPSQAPTDVLGG